MCSEDLQIQHNIHTLLWVHTHVCVCVHIYIYTHIHTHTQLFATQKIIEDYNENIIKVGF